MSEVSRDIEWERELLARRARALARAPEDPAGPSRRLEFVQFTMAHERYAVAAPFVREVYPLTALTPLPGTPAFVLGIVNVRGRILSLIDLKKFFSLPEKGLAETDQIIVLSSDDMEFGILADSIQGVRHIDPSELQHELPTLTGLRREYLAGVSADGTVVLDARRILRDPDVVVSDPDID